MTRGAKRQWQAGRTEVVRLPAVAIPYVLRLCKALDGAELTQVSSDWEKTVLAVEKAVHVAANPTNVAKRYKSRKR